MLLYPYEQYLHRPPALHPSQIPTLTDERAGAASRLSFPTFKGNFCWLQNILVNT